ncbi:lytic murein transglycosylase [Mesorhizobium sp. B2-3-2]|nr:lytic murein transglycosylase [Mesorhizobium sp. B2-3-2]
MRGVCARTPLCPAGHLPLKGGDGLLFLISPIAVVAEFLQSVTLPISPLEGEMSGRTEGGT